MLKFLNKTFFPEKNNAGKAVDPLANMTPSELNDTLFTTVQGLIKCIDHDALTYIQDSDFKLFEKMLEKLIAKGVDINAKINYYTDGITNTADYLILQNILEGAEITRKLGANIDMTSALKTFAVNNNVKGAAWAIDNGADCTIPYEKGGLITHIFAQHGNLEGIELGLKNGIDANAKEKTVGGNFSTGTFADYYTGHHTNKEGLHLYFKYGGIAEEPIFEYCASNGDLNLVKQCAEKGGIITNSIIRAAKESDKDSYHFLITQKNLDKETKHTLSRTTAFYLDSDHTDKPRPSIKNLAGDGEIYPYAAYTDTIYKIDESLLKKIFKDNSLASSDKGIRHRLLNKIISNYNTGDSPNNWGKISELNQDINSAKFDEIADTIKEINKYIGLLEVARVYQEANMPERPAQFDNKKLDRFLGYKSDTHGHEAVSLPIIAEYLLENKTLPQMAKMSKEWHRLRSDLLKSGSLKSGAVSLRDFSAGGEWHQITEEKEIKITQKGLEDYTLVSLTTGLELDEEGKKLNHCVSSKDGECKSGNLHIFSIRKDGEPCTTLGLTFNGKRPSVYQHYGYNDRSPNSQEQAIETWFLEKITEPEKNGKKEIRINLDKVGSVNNKGVSLSPFEEALGIKLEDLTPERIQHNLDLITSINRSHIYMFGKENNGIGIDEFMEKSGVKTAIRKDVHEVNAILAITSPATKLAEDHSRRNAINPNGIQHE